MQTALLHIALPITSRPPAHEVTANHFISDHSLTRGVGPTLFRMSVWSFMSILSSFRTLTPESVYIGCLYTLHLRFSSCRCKTHHMQCCICLGHCHSQGLRIKTPGRSVRNPLQLSRAQSKTGLHQPRVFVVVSHSLLDNPANCS